MGVEKMELDEGHSTLMSDTKKPPPVRPPNTFERIIQPCLAEVVGTMFFVFIGCVSVIENVESAGRVQPALVHGLAVAVMVACMDQISGSHFNPPFTIAIYLCGGMKLFMVVPYLISQLLGGVLGAAMSKMMTSKENYANATGAAFTILQSEDQLAGAIFGEIAMTCLVTMVVLLGAVNAKSKSPMVPFLVGCTVIINILAGGDVSGTCLNPARALGPAVMANYWTYHWVYWAGPIAGGLLAAGLVRLVLGDEKTRVIMK
ncbi:aquaporin-8a.2 [Oncorhynchus nerka]|uniref:aquaporin-8a.2 n=1 Tax=Oncorhynchus nerka TaxID=8023 RepID=UPI0011321506|nr:aquaporin-8-like [Oncorhynchus nerka]XP_029540910.1 aquaporin-8-like [Oncorhynchus nerka]